MSKSKPPGPSAFGLKRVKLLEGVPTADLEQLAKQCRWEHCTAGRNIISRAARDRDVYMIVSGSVRVTLFSTSGRQVTYRDIPAGDWFGDFSAIDGLSRSANVIALEDSLVAALTPTRFCELLQEHAVVCNRVMQRLVSAVRELTERVFELSTLGVRNRVHAELLRLAKQAGVEANQARIDPAPTHEEIANRVSTDRSEVTRELSKMANQGTIQRTGRALLIPDIIRLEKMVAEVLRAP